MYIELFLGNEAQEFQYVQKHYCGDHEYLNQIIVICGRTNIFTTHLILSINKIKIIAQKNKLIKHQYPDQRRPPNSPLIHYQ